MREVYPARVAIMRPIQRALRSARRRPSFFSVLVSDTVYAVPIQSLPVKKLSTCFWGRTPNCLHSPLSQPPGVTYPRLFIGVWRLAVLIVDRT